MREKREKESEKAKNEQRAYLSQGTFPALRKKAATRWSFFSLSDLFLASTASRGSFYGLDLRAGSVFLLSPVRRTNEMTVATQTSPSLPSTVSTPFFSFHTASLAEYLSALLVSGCLRDTEHVKSQTRLEAVIQFWLGISSRRFLGKPTVYSE